MWILTTIVNKERKHMFIPEVQPKENWYKLVLDRDLTFRRSHSPEDTRTTLCFYRQPTKTKPLVALEVGQCKAEVLDGWVLPSILWWHCYRETKLRNYTEEQATRAIHGNTVKQRLSRVCTNRQLMIDFFIHILVNVSLIYFRYHSR